MKNIKAITYIVCLILCSLKVRAQIPLPLFWDAGHTSGASLGGTGNWDTSSLLWYNGSTDTTWNNAISFDAYFSGTSGTVTLTTPINVADIYFTNTIGGYVITNSSSANTLTLGNGIVDTGGSTNTIGAVLAGTAGLTKTNNGTLILSGNNSGFSGPVTVVQGALETTTTNGLGSQTVTVTNAGSVQFASGSIVTNPFVVSGGGGNNLGALVDLTNWVYIATTNSGPLTLETSNIVFGCDVGTFYLQGGLAAANGVNASVVFTGPGAFRVSYAGASAKVINLHTGSITVNGGSINVAATSFTYSNLVLNGGQFSSGLKDASFGTAPSSFNANNITLSNSANLLLSTTFTFNGNRGIYLGPGGTDIGENTASGQLTIPGAISGPGSLLLETDGAGSSFKLTGANTYSGLTTVQSGTGLVIGSGTGTGTFGTGNILDNGSVTVNRTGTLTYAGGISGSGSLSLTSGAGGIVALSGQLSQTGALSIGGPGTVIFSGSNTYSANTLTTCQFFLVENTNGSATSTGTLTVGNVSGGDYLGGTGIISGPVTIVQANTLQPGDPSSGAIGTLTISNSLILQPGSVCNMDLDATIPAGSAVVGLTSVTYGGTLNVTPINGTPAAGQTYQLFQAASYHGSFEGGLNLPSLPGGLAWNTNNLSVNGSITVVALDGIFNPPVYTGTNVVLSGTGGNPFGSFSLLSSTNLQIPFQDWTVVSTGNAFDQNGDFNITNPVDPTVPQQFFLLSQP